MAIEIEVSNPTEENENRFYDFNFHHKNCGEIKTTRNPITSEFTLRCDCGLKIIFPQLGAAQTLIMHTVNDGVSRDLPDSSYSPNNKVSVRIIKRSRL
jgi:hypothetical protein